ncbi:MAG: hypothetical protein AAGC65_11235 [Mucilaginibacter sp.]|uniref:hypothetical protein n=1 Tax=Mucilaginibacter sp. TaxID=1882438 RepID=UPI0031A7D417
MYNVSAFAVKNGETIDVTISGNLSDSCRRAIIRDIYPGGDIIYVRDPGEAQVFIKEWSVNDTAVCAMVLIPWSATISIPTTKDIVSVFINGHKATTVNVLSDHDQYNVWELTGGIIPPNGSYSILPASVNLGHPWDKQYGPDNYKSCSEWILKQPRRQPLEVDLGIDGGGSEAPRGVSVDAGGGGEFPRGLKNEGGGEVPRGLFTSPRFIY